MDNGSRDNLVQSNEIIELLKNPIAHNFIADHINEKPDSLALTFKNKVPFDLTKLTQLLQLYHKAKHKIPLWVSSRCAMHSKSYEQCSHHEVSKFKSTLVKGNLLLDLTAGLGVDSYYFSKQFNNVVSLEKDTNTFAFNKYNTLKLKATNISVIHGDLETFDFQNDYDVIYLDPDRRLSGQTQLRSVETYSPDIFVWYKKLLTHCKTLLIKLSPMVDINYLEQQIPEITATYVIAYKNEVKELLLKIDSNADNTVQQRIAVDINQHGTQQYIGKKNYEMGELMASPKVILEPSKSIIKAELGMVYAKLNKLKSIHPKSQYFFSDQTLDNFMGRQFEIIEDLPVQWSQIKKHLKARKIKAINVAQRNFYHDVKAIRNKLNIKEGGTQFLLFTIDINHKARCFYCEPIVRVL